MRVLFSFIHPVSRSMPYIPFISNSYPSKPEGNNDHILAAEIGMVAVHLWTNTLTTNLCATTFVSNTHILYENSIFQWKFYANIMKKLYI